MGMNPREPAVSLYRADHGRDVPRDVLSEQSRWQVGRRGVLGAVYPPQSAREGFADCLDSRHLKLGDLFQCPVHEVRPGQGGYRVLAHVELLGHFAEWVGNVDHHDARIADLSFGFQDAFNIGPA